MLMRVTATVKNGEVRIRGVDLPDGDKVDVTIEEPVDEDGLTASDWRGIEQREAEIAAGKWRYLDDVIADARQLQQELRRQNGRPSRPNGQARGRKVGGGARPRSKSTTRRTRNGA